MINITSTAKEKIEKALEERGLGIGILIGIKTSGCNGYAYYMEYADRILEQTEEFKFEKFSVIIKKEHLVYLDGITIDYVKKGLNEGFEYLNPKEVSRCGCGESVQI